MKNKNFYEWLMNEYPNPEYVGGQNIASAHEDFAYTVKHDETFPKNGKRKEIEEYLYSKEGNLDYYGGFCAVCPFNDLWIGFKGKGEDFCNWLNFEYEDVKENANTCESVEKELADEILEKCELPFTRNRKRIEEYLRKFQDDNPDFYDGYEVFCVFQNIWRRFKKTKGVLKQKRV